MKKVELKKVINLRISIFFFTLYILPACAPLISPEDVLRSNDTIDPIITITKPAEGSYYAALVSVEGKAEDKADSQGAAGEVLSPLHYEVMGTNISGEVSLAPDGAFAFSFSTDGLVEEKTLWLKVTDWNSNEGEAKIVLKSGGAFTGFTAVPGNQYAYITWQPVDVAESYTLFYTDDGNDPSPTNHIGEEPLELNPADLEYHEDTGYIKPLYNLKNGYMYSFLLRANIPAAGSSWSGVVQAVPVSPFTLAPHITGGYKKITVEWDAIPGTNRFILSRAVDKDGPYTDFSANITGTRYEDTHVTDGTLYYYKVRPALASAVSSGCNSGETVPVVPFGQLVKAYDTPGYAYDILLRDNLAFVADKDAGLHIIDISNPAAPVFKGEYDTPGNTFAIALEGEYAYLADDGSGLQIVNISNPADPQFVGACKDIDGYALDVAVRTDRAYIAAGDGGVVLLDISDRSTPGVITALAPGAGEAAYGITLSGDYAYAASGSAGLRIIDITNPADLVPVSYFNTNGTAYDVIVAGDYAYVADNEAGLQIINIADKAHPVLAGSCDTPGHAIRITLDGNYAYLADDIGGMHMIDISNPAAPRIAGSYDSYDKNIYVKAVVTRGRYSYLACQSEGIRIINTGGPHRMEVVCDYNSVPGVKRVAVSGNFAYLAEINQKLHVLDITDPAAPVPAATVDLLQDSSPYGVSVCGDYALVTGNLLDLQIIGIENPRQPHIVSSIPVAKYPYKTMDAALHGDYVYILYSLAAGDSGVKIFSIANPEFPDEIGSFPVEKNAQSIRIKGNYLYTANYSAGLHITDISRPDEARFYRKIDTPGSASDVELFDDYAFIADGYEGIRLINIEDPFYPEYFIDSDTLGMGFASDTVITGHYALTAYGISKKLLVINIDKPAKPLFMGALQTGGNAKYITTRGKYAYLTLENTGLQIIDLWPFTE